MGIARTIIKIETKPAKVLLWMTYKNIYRENLILFDARYLMAFKNMEIRYQI